MAIKLTQEDAAKLRDKQLANVIRKLNDGKTLTAREEALLAQARADGAAGESGGVKCAQSGYAKSWDELALALRVDRRTLTTFRTKHAGEIKAKGRDLTRADGRHVIAAWGAFLEERGCRGQGVNAAPDEELPGLPSESELKRRKMKLEIERSEFAFEKERSRMLEVAHFEEALGHMLATFRQSLDALPSRCAGKLGELDVRKECREQLRASYEDLKAAKSEDEFLQIAEALIVRMLPEPDYHFRKQIIEGEVEIVKRTLRECHYLEPRENSTIPVQAAVMTKAVKTVEVEGEADGEE